MYGTTDTTPLTGDWNGDRTTTVGALAKKDGQWEWRLRNTNNAGAPDLTFLYGRAEATPLTGQWVKGGLAQTPAVVRPDGQWRWELRNTNNAGPTDLRFDYGWTGK